MMENFEIISLATAAVENKDLLCPIYISSKTSTIYFFYFHIKMIPFYELRKDILL